MKYDIAQKVKITTQSGKVVFGTVMAQPYITQSQDPFERLHGMSYQVKYKDENGWKMSLISENEIDAYQDLEVSNKKEIN